MLADAGGLENFINNFSKQDSSLRNEHYGELSTATFFGMLLAGAFYAGVYHVPLAAASVYYTNKLLDFVKESD